MKTKSGFQFLCLALLFVLSHNAAAQSRIPFWQVVNPSRADLNGVAYGNGRFVATGSDGYVAISMDGTSWRRGKRLTDGGLRGVVYADSRFAVSGSDSSQRGKVYFWPDGLTWIGRNLTGIPYGVNELAWGAGLWVGVGSGGKAARSTDGLAWEIIEPFDRYMNSVAHGNGVFVAVGANGRIYSSPDGMIWTRQTVGTSEYLWRVRFLNSGFVAVGGGGVVLRSGDGQLWQRELVDRNISFEGIAYGAGTYVAVGARYEYQPHEVVLAVCYSSSDLIQWTDRSPTGRPGLLDVVHGDGLFVAVGQLRSSALSPRPTGVNVLTSPDGLNWTGRDPRFSYFIPGSPSVIHVVRGNPQYVGITPNGEVWRRPHDDIEWVPGADLGTTLHGLAYSKGVYVIVGEGHQVWRSEDAETWTPHPIGQGIDRMKTITHTGQEFVALGEQDGLSIAATSTDGVTWQTHSLDTFYPVTGLAAGGGLCLAVLRDGRAIRSTDGRIWHLDTQRPSTNFNAVAFGRRPTFGGHENLFVAVGNNDTVRVLGWQPFANDWQWGNSQGTRSTGNDLRLVAFGLGAFFVGGSQDGLFRSSDGFNWDPMRGFSESNLLAMVADQDLLLVTGEDELLAELILPPVVLNITPREGGLRLTIEASPLERYSIQQNHSLDGQTPWTTIWTATAFEDLLEFDLTEPADATFFRALQEVR